MKTRTLLLWSVGIGLLILIAGGALLFQLSGQQNAVEPTALGERAGVGDLEIVVSSSSEVAGVFSVEVELSGVDDGDLDGFSLVTGDQRLQPLASPAAGRCVSITVAEQSCRVEFDTSAVESPNRTLVVVRGEEQRNWRLSS